MTNTQLWLSLLLNAFVALAVLGGCGAFFLRGGQGNMQQSRWKALVYFTVDSNLLCALSCLAAAVWEALALIRGGGALLPRWLDLCKLTAATAVGVTFFTVLFYLLPVTHFDFRLMYAGRNFFLHALCPLAAMAAWALTERGEPLAFGWALLGLVPTLLYGAVYVWMVLVKKQWEDFYRFNAGGKWYISVAAMLLLSFAIAAALWALRGVT